MGPLDKHMLQDDALSAAPDGWRLQLRSHWYRSLPLSSVGVLQVEIDGNEVLPTAIEFEVNGRRHALSALAALHDEWWFILDAAILHIHAAATCDAGTTHDISVELGLLIPYILIGPRAEPLLSSSRITRILHCRAL